MGLAASQTRFLTLTARKSDLEYQAQQISNARLVLSKQLEDIATKYTDSQENRNLFTSGVSPLSYQQINTTNLATAGLQVMVVGKNVLYDNYTPAAGEVKKSLEDGLRDGTYVLLQQATSSSQDTMTDPAGLTGTYATSDWRTNPAISDDLLTADDGKAETEYDQKTAAINQQDKTLTLESAKLETDHKAVESELEAIKKVIQSNAESSFKTFA